MPYTYVLFSAVNGLICSVTSSNGTNLPQECGGDGEMDGDDVYCLTLSVYETEGK